MSTPNLRGDAHDDAPRPRRPAPKSSELPRRHPVRLGARRENAVLWGALAYAEAKAAVTSRRN